ncbi:hypothetical protein [Clostridium sp. KNHs205]|uniref:hypothetical protein n=1 Tax=Clostridium sp. KNHs205 TaxID=1449050 RepID=UPI00051B9ABB|nr:hypothetical protein [Clostridium sp. KNHs205]
METILGSIVTILSVIIGGVITYYVSKREIKRNKKIEVYLDFLNVAQGRYYTKTPELTEEYMNVLRKMYLIASIELLNAIESSGYIPTKQNGKYEWPESNPDNIEQPLKLIVIAMRKDIGDYKRKLEEFNYINFYPKPKK